MAEDVQQTSRHQDVATASNLSDIHATLDQLSQRERAVTQKLDALVASQKDLSRQLGRLDVARASLGPQVNEIRSISKTMLAPAAATASRISGAVKSLDSEQAAVKETLKVVEQVVELKACVLGVHGAMEGTQDWELAATYVNRASKVPREVIEGAFAEDIVPTVEVPDAPRVTLDNAAENLCALFLREFEKAVKDGDGARVTRFFKLFPLIQRQDVGLDAYGRYVCGGVAARSRANLGAGQKKDGMFYVATLTKLFEHIAQIVENHEPVVTRHYGSGMMDKVVQRLQAEADLQGGIILDTWMEEGHVSRNLTDVKSYAFTFLVQSFLATQKSAIKLRSASPMTKDGSEPRASEDEGVDMKEIDALLNQMATMLSRWALYSRFISGKTKPTVQDEDSVVISPLILHSTLQKKTSDYLVETFNSMTTFYFRRSVEKAFQMDEPPQDLSLNANKPLGASPPFITSAVDDVMYILNQVLQRAIGTSQRQVVASVIPAISRVLNSDFYGMIQRQMRDESYPKPAVQGAALPPESIIISFLLLMNNLDISTNYVRRIVTSQLGPQVNGTADPGDEHEISAMASLFPFGHDATFVEGQVQNILTSFQAKTSELLTEAVEVLLRHVLRQRLRPVLVETFRDTDYSHVAQNSDDGARAREQDTTDDEIDPVSRRFERGWIAFMLPIKRLVSERNYEMIHAATVQHLAKVIEKRVWSMHQRGVSPLGAIKLERDVTELIAVAVRGGKYALREAFGKVIQMLLVLNMDEEEWEEMQRAGEGEGPGGMEWKLDGAERDSVRELMV